MTRKTSTCRQTKLDGTGLSTEQRGPDCRLREIRGRAENKRKVLAEIRQNRREPSSSKHRWGLPPTYGSLASLCFAAYPIWLSTPLSIRVTPTGSPKSGIEPPVWLGWGFVR